MAVGRETDVAKCCHGVWDHFAHQANPILGTCFFVIFRVITSSLGRHLEGGFTSMDQSIWHGGSHPATISELVDASSVYNLGSVDSSSQVPDREANKMGWSVVEDPRQGVRDNFVNWLGDRGPGPSFQGQVVGSRNPRCPSCRRMRRLQVWIWWLDGCHHGTSVGP